VFSIVSYRSEHGRQRLTIRADGLDKLRAGFASYKDCIRSIRVIPRLNINQPSTINLMWLRLEQFDGVAQFGRALVEFFGDSGFHFPLHHFQFR